MFGKLLHLSGVFSRTESKTTAIRRALSWITPVIIISLIIPLNMGYNGISSCIVTFVTLYLSRKNPLTFYFSCTALLCLSLYIPVGYSFGKISYAYVVSALQTNSGEFLEFLRGTSLNAWLLTSSAILAIYLFARNGQDFDKKYRTIYLIAFILINLNAWPKRMLTATAAYAQQANSALAGLEQNSNVPDNFQIISNHKKYKNVVVVIGESVARDYLSVYGYPHNTTPWLNTAPGYFYTHYISAAPNTFLSLSRTLTISDGVKTEEYNSIVALAKKAGFSTHWISNQGFLGEYDTPATVIASKAQHKVFFKKGDYNTNSTDDMALLGELQRVVKNNDNAHNAVFLHMIGSHPDTCSRLNDFPVNFNISHQQKLNCYLATLQKLDAFLEHAHQILEQRGESYALIYFSDHGMTVDESERPVRHGADARQNFNIPLFLFTSDTKKHITDDTPISARKFMSLFEWIAGFDSDKVPALSPGEAAERDITVFNGEHLVPYDELKENAIVQ
ncbi:phosphoethanolamine transferase [[Enterobacter] lignolyticus]|uniref:Sulfatase n=1 Tax=Enterobacter lignolyticus (strain SCF1) TaxID=701347 RepID=E3G8X0_ENTLS|nr:phosphoethanolamine transferase [[Enterobacter] lignolyticus]ADO48691.1 sulfatase [[Enterobacter] lignolyticus SCF1]